MKMIEKHNFMLKMFIVLSAVGCYYIVIGKRTVIQGNIKIIKEDEYYETLKKADGCGCSPDNGGFVSRTSQRTCGS
jgi:hypothetical protein